VIEDAAARILSLARSCDLTTPVDHLNRWKVRDVVAHLGGVHEWATRVIRERSMAGAGARKSKLDGDDLCDWFEAGAATLVNELRSHDPAEPCPNFNPGSENTLAWWIRRQAHETTVHRWDVEAALGATTAIEPKVAADGVDEFLDVFVRTRGKQTLADTLVLRTTRPKRTWTLTPASKPGRIDVAVGDSGDIVAATEVVGKPAALLLALWGRQSAHAAGLKISGDPATAAALLTL